ncbi:MAG: ABC transporter substrate-binding protein [Candidatus Rokubacteria bacterium]|nr:ABC transporter substrate-binding protein [Candidatus Rokubacteria bacterium]
MGDDFSRREVLKLGGTVLALGTVGAGVGLLRPGSAIAATPKRGGTLRFRGYDPDTFDIHMRGGNSYKPQIVHSFTHSRLLKYKAGPSVQPGTFPIEGDLAESWTQPNEVTYLFKLREGVRWHNKPPVNGRELTAEDVKYTFERFLASKENANRYMMVDLDKVEVLDKYRVKFTLKKPFAWFLDYVATPMALAIVAREAAEKFGDLRKAEAVIGTGPWILEKHDIKSRIVYVRNPDYFLSGLPYIDRIEAYEMEDKSTRLAAFLSGQLDLGPEFVGTVLMNTLKEVKERRPNLKMVEFTSNVMTHIGMRTDKPPFNDVRVRRAISLAIDRQAILKATNEGRGELNPPVPAALKEWSIPWNQLGEGARYYEYNPAEAKRLLAEAGYGKGFEATIDFFHYGSQELQDAAQMIIKYLGDVGIKATLNQKPSYAAYISTSYLGKFESMVYGPQLPALDPDNFLGQYHPANAKNQSHVNDPAVTDQVERQRATLDVAKRKKIIHDLQRHLATQQYYVQLASGITNGAWDPALKNYMPNLGFDYGGRLMAAWWDK